MYKDLRAFFGSLVLLMLTCQAYGQDNQNDLAALKEMSLEELMNIEVTSVSKRPEKLVGTASAIQVITQEDIRHSGATTVAEALRLATNLQVAQVNSSQWAISARGFNNVLANKLLVLIDGRVVYTPLYAGVFWDVQNLILNDIERIEVISGPGGTLWGANAVNGVINIITKKASDTQGVYAEAATGTELRGLGSLRYGGKISERLSYRVLGTAFKRDNTIFRDSIEARDNWHMTQGGLRLDWDATDYDVVTLQGNLYNGRPDPDGGAPVVARGMNLLSKWNHNTQGGSAIQVQAFVDQTWRDFRNGFAENLRTYDVEAQQRFEIGNRHNLIYGAGFRAMDHEVNNLELFNFLPGQKWLFISSLFVQDDISLVEEKLGLTVGLKTEHNSYTKFQHQPNARLTWTPGANQTVWSAVSRAVRNPSRIDRDFNLYIAPGVPFIASGNFQSEEVLAYELGWRFQYREQLSVSIATFYNEYDNVRTVESGPPPIFIPVTFGNGIEGETYGVELSATYHLSDWWRLRGGYTRIEKDLRIKSTTQIRMAELLKATIRRISIWCSRPWTCRATWNSAPYFATSTIFRSLRFRNISPPTCE
jgi:iron complex outermembrane receptor protein